ncbi:MAG TPA: hypothetical protein VFM18_18395 [Methanosarcina sp.]|nr:hypothetical protein [Methanosarcina sp.]
MNYDKYGRPVATESELCDLLYQNPNLNLDLFFVTGNNGEIFSEYNKSVDVTYAGFEKVREYFSLESYKGESIEEFDAACQANWYMPSEYRTLDIAKFVLDLCQTEQELQRVGQELLLYQERDLFDLLRYLKYFVDTMRSNNVVWGLGRGSSTASYVLFLLGVHRINSIYYDLEIEEFLK